MPKGYGLSEATKDAIWELRAEGLSDREIGGGSAFPGEARGTTWREREASARARRRPESCLSLEEREEISRAIAAVTGPRDRPAPRSLPTTIAREISRCGGRRAIGPTPQSARPGAARDGRGRRGRALSRASPGGLRAPRRRPLPRADRGLAPARYPDNEAMQVSHETIYRWLYVQARGTLRRELTRHLRRGRSRRYARSRSSRARAKASSRHGDDLRASAGGRGSAVPGHREGDLLMGNRRSYERERDPGRGQNPLLPARRPPRGAWRRGGLRGAQAEHHHPAGPASPLAHLGPGLGDVRAPALLGRVRGRGLLLRPRSPWQRGSNENTNGLLRQYFPKGKSLAGVGQERLDEVAEKLNRRPRKTRVRNPGGEAHRAARRPRAGRRRALISLRPTAFARQR